MFFKLFSVLLVLYGITFVLTLKDVLYAVTDEPPFFREILTRIETHNEKECSLRCLSLEQCNAFSVSKDTGHNAIATECELFQPTNTSVTMETDKVYYKMRLSRCPDR